MTLREIAEAAHVSIGTVDRVLHNRGRVSPEVGIDISHNVTKSVFDFSTQGRRYDVVVTVCSKEAAERCPIFLGSHRKLHWPFPDPSTLAGSESEKIEGTRRIRDMIEDAVKDFAKATGA